MAGARPRHALNGRSRGSGRCVCGYDFRRRRARAAALAALALCAVASPAAAQYFGRNKVQYEDFNFRVLRTAHFDIHFYPEEEVATRDAARQLERWYTRFAPLFGYTFDRRDIILYADQPDFQQTNVVGGTLEEGTGGVTEGLRSRVVLPLTGIYRDN